MSDDTEVDEAIEERLFQNVFNRFIALVLFARVGNGTWHEDDSLKSFQIEWPTDDDLDVRVRINDEDMAWSHARAAHAIEPDSLIRPTDVVVESLSVSEHPAERYIHGVLTDRGWKIDVQLNRPHPRRTDHLKAARDFVAAAELLLGQKQTRAFYESAFHAAEHLAQAELLSYVPTAEIVSESKTHRTIRSTYNLWARLGNTDDRFAKLLTALEHARQRDTYLRTGTGADAESAEQQLALLREMLDWVVGIVEQGREPVVIHLVASRPIMAGELVGTDDLQLRGSGRLTERAASSGNSTGSVAEPGS